MSRLLLLGQKQDACLCGQLPQQVIPCGQRPFCCPDPMAALSLAYATFEDTGLAAQDMARCHKRQPWIAY